MGLATLSSFALSLQCMMLSRTLAFHISPRLSLTSQSQMSQSQIQHPQHSATPTSLLALSGTKDARAAPSVVVDKFDKYAPTFENHLVDTLEYCAPQYVAKAASERVTNRGGDMMMYASALDAGCGTGLAGPLLRELVSGSLIGVDLSPKMAELAAELVVDDGPVPLVKNRMRRCSETARNALGSDAPERLYDGVFTADLLHLTEAEYLDGYGLEVQEMLTEKFDLIVSADVLCYFGAMDDVLKVFSDRMDMDGDVIFTTETMKAGDYNWVETSSGRYAHCPEYIARVAAEAGLAKVSQVPFSPRMESGEKVLGTLHTFTKR